MYNTIQNIAVASLPTHEPHEQEMQFHGHHWQSQHYSLYLKTHCQYRALVEQDMTNHQAHVVDPTVVHKQEEEPTTLHWAAHSPWVVSSWDQAIQVA